MEMRNQSYFSAIFYGLYMYLFYQVINFLRFGSFLISCVGCEHVDSTSFLIVNHGAPYLLGVFSVLLLFYFAKRHETSQRKLLVAFVVAIPFSFFFSLMGGLLGFFGMLIFGLVPFVIGFIIFGRK